MIRSCACYDVVRATRAACALVWVKQALLQQQPGLMLTQGHWQLCRAGVTDHLAESEPHAISIARNILGNLNQAAAGMCTTWAQQLPNQAIPQPLPQSQGHGTTSWEEPLYPAQEMRGEGQFLYAASQHLYFLYMFICYCIIVLLLLHYDYDCTISNLYF